MRFYTRKRRSPQIIIVALIDIFAILLIFMVMTTQFVDPEAEKPQPSVPVNLPESKSAVVAAAPEKAVELTIDEHEKVFLASEPVEVDALVAAIEALMEKTPATKLALRVDKKAPFGIVIKVLDTLKAAGVKGNLSALTEAPSP